ncbi:hypothetical protein [Clostridium perfringens]|uniref:hypothetical protein n=1 Tax=Clostridium perfringens TaxID=1502 RepID=UPI000F53ABDC|nr:hypothetical protein [Clostridium perfringens]DAO46968.1 MAG TPA: hypothetical protein [Bacteriophage sp.]EJT6172480.1 hypothetical protein [Clostridium perfringens]EJT6340648.1 hypothetical protein [Clostridium perfringens]EJT6543192.1 hypothetical protein [Clostridium perfringens]EJT6568213.1 hypothetical protein [Clostridium perfringens]
MAKVYNIMNKLTNEKPVLKIDEDHEYKINNSKNNAIYIQSLVKNKDKQGNDIEVLDKIVKASLPKEAFEYIESLDLSLDAYSVIVNAIMAGISNLELDEIEELNQKEMERFQKEKK